MHLAPAAVVTALHHLLHLLLSALLVNLLLSNRWIIATHLKLLIAVHTRGICHIWHELVRKRSQGTDFIYKEKKKNISIRLLEEY